MQLIYIKFRNPANLTGFAEQNDLKKKLDCEIHTTICYLLVSNSRGFNEWLAGLQICGFSHRWTRLLFYRSRTRSWDDDWHLKVDVVVLSCDWSGINFTLFRETESDSATGEGRYVKRLIKNTSSYTLIMVCLLFVVLFFLYLIQEKNFCQQGRQNLAICCMWVFDVCAPFWYRLTSQTLNIMYIMFTDLLNHHDNS